MNGEVDPVPSVYYGEEFEWDEAHVSFPCCVSVRIHDQKYGGPEEGGWWYDTWDTIATLLCQSKEQLAIQLTSLKNEFSNEGRHKLSSVCSEGLHEILVTKKAPLQHEPEVRPHYE